MPEISQKKLARLMDPAAFVRAGSGELARTSWATRLLRWEVHHGRLLPERFVTQTRRFLVSHLLGREQYPEIPFLSILIDEETRSIHVVRYLRMLLNEPYMAENNVVLTREVPGWTRELVASVSVDDFLDESSLLHDLSRYVFEAVVGVSRLPLTSIEAPLPEFSLGRLMYLPDAADPPDDADSPVSHWTDTLTRIPREHLARAKWLEFLLRMISPSECGEFAAVLCSSLRRGGVAPGEFARLVREMINNVSLSPYTDFADNLLNLLTELVERSYLEPEDHIDLLSWMLRQLGRHLTAYDLIIFHHQGANYPDALFLDAILKSYLEIIASRPECFSEPEHRLRRRALRQAYLIRKTYEGHPVPDAPTSPGENQRILSDDIPPVPEEQIVSIARRRRRLYEGDPIERHFRGDAIAILKRSIADLHDERELRELGTAVFIDRPLGLAKFPGEPDRTPLVSHVAWSRKVTLRRLEQIRKWQADADIDWQSLQAAAEQLPQHGIAAEIYQRQPQRVVSLADACRTSDDYRFLRTTRSAVESLVRDYLQGTGLQLEAPWLLLPEPEKPDDREVTLVGYGRDLKPRWRLVADLRKGYQLQRGWDYPVGGFQLHSAACD